MQEGIIAKKTPTISEGGNKTWKRRVVFFLKDKILLLDFEVIKSVWKDISRHCKISLQTIIPQALPKQQTLSLSVFFQERCAKFWSFYFIWEKKEGSVWLKYSVENFEFFKKILVKTALFTMLGAPKSRRVRAGEPVMSCKIHLTENGHIGLFRHKALAKHGGIPKFQFIIMPKKYHKNTDRSYTVRSF